MLTLVATAVVAAGVARRRVRRYEVAEESMAPELMPGDYLLTVPAGNPWRGDLVVFPHPARPGFELVKRVVALPGRHVTIGAGQVHLDGAPLAERWADGPTRPEGEWTVPAGHVFVLGDRRSVSVDDSRQIGPVPIQGAWRVAARYWPAGRIGLISPRRDG